MIASRAPRCAVRVRVIPGYSGIGASTVYLSGSTLVARVRCGAWLYKNIMRRDHDRTGLSDFFRFKGGRLNSNLEQATGLVEALLIKARSKIDQAEICRLRMLLQLRQGDYAPANLRRRSAGRPRLRPKGDAWRSFFALNARSSQRQDRRPEHSYERHYHQTKV